MRFKYTLYLVTDSSPELLKGRNIVDVVEDAIRGGVTVVQLREKNADAAQLVAVGKRLHAVTKKHGVPLIINDRVDVALAVGAEGVHLGQDDLDPQTARTILGPDAIIGVSVSSVDEAKAAVATDVNYLGIGTVHKTPTKDDSKRILGPAGVREILDSLESRGSDIKTVAIGGINATNVNDLICYALTPASKRSLDGVAVVSAIMGADDPTKAAHEMRVAASDAFDMRRIGLANHTVLMPHELLERIGPIVRSVAKSAPLSHNMTNLVVQNFAANVALAVGGSPIMANYGGEAADLAQISPGALVVNMGSVDPAGVQNYVEAVSAYNRCNRPVLLDPVGAGATQLRRQAVRTLLDAGRFSIVKGNESEIRAVLGVAAPGGEEQPQQRGVDSGSSGLDLQQRARLAYQLAREVRAVVLMTGATDLVTDGLDVYAISNGHELLGKITGSGCTLGTVISCCLAVEPSDVLVACVAGVLLFELAAERAAGMMSVNGPGTFVPALIDKLAEISGETAAGNETWLEQAQVKAVYLEKWPIN